MSAGKAETKLQTLADTLKPFVADADGMDSGRVFQEWMLQALMQYLKQGTSSSFAPFNAYFGTPRDFRQSFNDFFRAEVQNAGEGTARFERMVVLALQNMLQYTIDHVDEQPGYRETAPSRLNHFVFELFEVLMDFNSEDAFEWAARAVSGRTGFAAMLGPNGSPAPLELYFSLVGDDMAGHEKARFLSALLDWCNRNADRPEVLPVAWDMLPTVLRSIGGAERADKQIELLTRLCSPQDKKFGLIVLFEALITNEEIELDVELYEDEVNTIRNAVDVAVPTLVGELDEGTKKKWRSSNLLLGAFRDKLRDSGDETAAKSRPPKLFVKNFGGGGIFDAFGLQYETMASFIGGDHVRRPTQH